MRIVVIGAGITGLTLGYRLTRRLRQAGRPDEVLVLEAGARPGGHATTIVEDGFLVEAGPNGFLDRYREPQTRELVDELGLKGRLREADPRSKRRFVRIGGRLRLVPLGPPSLLSTDILSPAGKLRLMLEPFIPRSRKSEETVYEFAARRIGREAAENLVDAAVSGISAGDSRELIVDAAFPVMTEMEREHGSLVKAMIARRRQPVAKIFSFDGGLATLTGTLAERLGSALRTRAAVESLARAGDRWRLSLAGGEQLEADRVIATIAAHQSAGLLRGLDARLADALEEIPFAGLALVALAYRESDLPRPLDGYGYLVARRDSLDTLGVVWESSLFAGRAPAGHALLRCMLGGVRRPELAQLPEAELVTRARRELAATLALTAEPERLWVRRWPRAIAQYTRGHGERVERIRALAARHPGLDLVGTSYDGISFTAAVAAAESWAGRVLDGLASADGVPRAPARPLARDAALPTLETHEIA
jgi:oxygen-dependent protoporphyrinogen oxidase